MTAQRGWLLLAVEVPAATSVELVIGTILGLIAFTFGAYWSIKYLVRRSRRQSAEPSIDALLAGTTWRMAGALLLCVCGGLVLAAVWLPLRNSPIVFMGIWLAVLGLLPLLFLFARLDLLILKARAQRERRHLLQSSQDEIVREIKARRTSEPDAN